jgi:NAD(P)-dependent dehydrogenase (short-subunit alcohol dehydrogenase family)
MRFELAGKTALVTGGARGIGLETARVLTERGANVVVVDLDPDAVERAAADLGERASGIAADVTDRGALQRAVAATVERYGGLDVVMANAGVAARVSTMLAMPTETFDRVLDVNIDGVVNTVQAALPEIVRRRGHIVVVASVYAFANGVGSLPYAMSKAAVEQMGRALRVELTPHGASASVAYFGFIETDMVRTALDGDPLAERMMASMPRVISKRLKPRAAAEAVVAGIEERRARIIVPRRWRIFFHLRGILGPLMDAHMERDAPTRELVAQLDARVGEDHPTTA